MLSTVTGSLSEHDFRHFDFDRASVVNQGLLGDLLLLTYSNYKQITIIVLQWTTRRIVSVRTMTFIPLIIAIVLTIVTEA